MEAAGWTLAIMASGPLAFSAPICILRGASHPSQAIGGSMLSDTDLIILRAAISLCDDARNRLTAAGLDSDDRSRQREAFYCAGAFDVARDALQSGLLNYEVRFMRPEPVAEPQSLRVPDDAAPGRCEHGALAAYCTAESCATRVPDDAA